MVTSKVAVAAAAAAAAGEEAKQAVTFEPQVASARIPRRRERLTEETSSDAHSNMSSDGQYEVIEYDFAHDTGGSSDIFQDVGTVSIQEDSPLAAALRANAKVHVSSVGKAARAVHMQTVRRVLKRAAGKPKSGNKKGKPPRVPPKLVSPPTLFKEEDEEENDDSGSESISSKSHTSVSPPLKQVHNEAHDDDDDSSFSEGEIEAKPAKSASEKQTQLDRDTMHIPDGVVPGTVEAGKKVLRSVDPHDLLKLVRWKRKKQGGMKKKKSYVKGKVIDGEHELYTLSIAVMIGVRTSISRTNSELNSLLPAKRWVRMADFRTTEKYEFHPKGDGPLPPHQLAHTFKFKDYSPLVFAYLRRMSGLNEFDFLLSVCGNANFIEFISNAKSGQFFFYSGDGRYMIKTMTNAESKFLRRILPQYFKHCCENPNTMITRFFGMYRVKLYHLRRNVKFVIMNSVYYTDKHLQTFFDLKGSSVGRDAKPGQAVLKDNDLRLSLPDNALALRPKQRSDVRGQLTSDCEFLKSMDIMDYSMLVGVHHVPPFEGRNLVTFKKGHKGAQARKNTGSSHGGDESEATDAASASKTPADGVVQESSVSSPVAVITPTKAQKRSGASGHNRVRSDNLVTHSFEDGLEDDDNSYLLGSENRLNINPSLNEETERKMQATIEKLFWPFHHYFDIHGHRRLRPAVCITCGGAPCNCEDKDSKLLAGYKIPKFVAPLSDRKDGGLEMDTTGMQLPMKVKGPSGELLYEGKIFYMGIIDILQEYSSRKELEHIYRMVRSPSRMAASCVPPMDYGRRFIDFFDQYTKRELKADTAEEGMEVSVRL